MTATDTRRRITIPPKLFIRMGFREDADVSSQQFTDRLERILNEREKTGSDELSVTRDSATDLARAILELASTKTAPAQALDAELASRLDRIERQQSAILEHTRATAALPKWFDVFRSEALNFMHHILKENAGVRQLLDRLTATDPDEVEDLKRQLDTTCQEARRVLEERKADYQELYSVHEAQLTHLRLLEGAEQTPPLEHERAQEEEMEHVR